MAGVINDLLQADWRLPREDLSEDERTALDKIAIVRLIAGRCTQ